MKNILIIAFFLNDENMGAIRIRRVAKALGKRGFAVTILSSHYIDLKLSDIPGVRIVRVKSVNLKKLYRGLRGFFKGNEVARKSGHRNLPRARRIGFTAWINRWLMIPDKQLPWFWPARRAGRRLLSASKFDLIYSSLEPRTNLLVAAKLAEEFGLPCILEYRDLWNQSPYHHQQQPTAVHRWLHRKLEQYVLDRATKLLALSKGIQDYLNASISASSVSKAELIHNFYDPEEFSPVPAIRDEPFTIVYTGAMYYSRNPFAFLRGLRLFIDRHEISSSQFRLKWMGEIVALPRLEGWLDELELAPYIDFEGKVEHSNALKTLSGADLALILQSEQDRIHIPGKLFEAFGARVPVLALAEPCETTEIIDEVNAGFHVDHDPNKVCQVLESFWEMKARGEMWRYDEEAVKQYSAERIMDKFVDLFGSVGVEYQPTFRS